MSDSDDDYIDIGEVDDIVDDVEGNESEVPEKNGIGRGKDIEWVEIARFKDKAAFETSHYFLDIKKYFTLRQGRESWYSDSEHYTCKFARKRSFEENFPTRVQLNTKIQHCRSIIRKTIQIFDTHQLRQKIEEKLGVPTDDTESYIAYNHVDDENEVEDPHFSIIWTSNKLIARISDDMTQDDAT
jgi:hypothetical protein